MNDTARFWFPCLNSALNHFWRADEALTAAKKAAREANKAGSKKDKKAKRLQKYYWDWQRREALTAIGEQFGDDAMDYALWPDGDKRDRRTKAMSRQKPKWYGELDRFIASEIDELKRERQSATGIKWDVDHMLPLMGETVSGLHCGTNLQLIPRKLNHRKNNRALYTEPWQWLSDLHLVADRSEMTA